MKCLLCTACRTYFRDPANQKLVRALFGDRGEDWAKVWEQEPDLIKLRHAYQMLTSEPRRGLSELQELADAGSPMSMVYLGDAFEMGTGTKVDLAEAATWFGRACQAGCADAFTHLGVVQSKLGDRGQAIETFMRGIAAGDRLTVYFLGSLYKNAPAPDRDLEKARELLARAAGWGNVYAQRDLASLLMKGDFGWRNRFRGLRLLLTSVRRALAVIRATDEQVAARSTQAKLQAPASPAARPELLQLDVTPPHPNPLRP
jgi:TPR repeat protein